MPERRAASGQIMPMVALLMVAIIGMTAFAIDGSNMYSQHRRLQADLDIAVKVGAAVMFDATSPSSSAYTYTVQQAITATVQTLANQGYPFTPSSSTLTPINGADYSHGVCATNTAPSINTTIKVCNPPINGAFTGRVGYTEGFLGGDIKGFFGKLIGLDKTHLNVRATALTGGFSTPYGLIGLGSGNPTSPSNCSILIKDAGTGTVVNGSAVGNDESCAQHSSTAAGSTSTDIYGTADYGAPFTEGNPYVPTAGRDGSNLVSPVLDPFAPPTYTTPTSTLSPLNPGASFSPCQKTLAQTLTGVSGATVPSNSHYYFAPITTTAGISTSIPVTVNLASWSNNGTYYFMPACDSSSTAPAVYVFTGGPSNGDQITSYNSTIVLSNGFTEPGNGSWSLQAPQTGPFANMAITQNYGLNPDGSVSCPYTAGSYPQITFTGATGVTTTGNVNLPCTDITVTGNSTTVVDGNITGNTITIQGSGGAVVNYRSDIAPKDKGSVLVE